MSVEPSYKIFSDLRWPLKTGIGNVMTALMERQPNHVEVLDLKVKSSIGSPFSSLAIARAIKSARTTAGVFWSAGFVPPASITLPTVVTVHDLTHLRFYTRFHKAYYDLFLKPLYRRCSAIICVSEYTRQEFLLWSGMPQGKVHVVLNGVGSAYRENQASFGLPYRYVLYPGNHRSYKNLDRLLAAFAISSLPEQDIHMVMTGETNPGLVAKAKGLGIDNYLHFLGYADNDELPKIYKGALFVAFVSLYEGFGLPIVEAMASGVPVLTSNTSAMPEVASDAALLVDPYSVADIARGLNALASNDMLRQELIGKGWERVVHFDWDRSARKLWSIVDRVYESA